MQPGDMAAMLAEVTASVQALLEALVIDTANDPNSKRTAERVARMLLTEAFAGRYEQPPAMTDFPNAERLDEIYVVGPVAIRSACSHHLVPVEGQVWCGVIPGERVIGLSKFSRLTRWIMARPQIQEEATVQLADALDRHLKPKGLAVIMRARHLCMTWRGVREHETTATTSVMRGIFKESPAARTELLTLIQGQRFSCQSSP